MNAKEFDARTMDVLLRSESDPSPTMQWYKENGWHAHVVALRFITYFDRNGPYGGTEDDIPTQSRVLASLRRLAKAGKLRLVDPRAIPHRFVVVRHQLKVVR